MRVNGYYWVKKNGEYIIAEWNDGAWCLFFYDGVGFIDSHFEEIDERQITRESFKKSMLAMAQIEAMKKASKAIDAALNIVNLTKQK